MKHQQWYGGNKRGKIIVTHIHNIRKACESIRFYRPLIPFAFLLSHSLANTSHTYIQHRHPSISLQTIFTHSTINIYCFVIIECNRWPFNPLLFVDRVSHMCVLHKLQIFCSKWEWKSLLMHTFFQNDDDDDDDIHTSAETDTF